MSTTTLTTFDFDKLRRAIEERDASLQLARYADDAEVRIVDRNNPPRTPRVLRGKMRSGSGSRTSPLAT
jgi:hypothetical protein